MMWFAMMRLFSITTSAMPVVLTVSFTFRFLTTGCEIGLGNQQIS